MTTAIYITTAAFAAFSIFFASVFTVRWVMRRFFVVPEEEEDKKRRRRREEEKPSYARLLLIAWGRRLSPYLPERFREDVEKRITMAGGLQGLTPAQIVLYAFFATVCGLAIGMLVVVATGWPSYSVLGISLGCTLLPFLWLRDQVKARHRQILADLAYHLDLLTLSVEAGLDFGAGVARMVEKGKPGALRQEFAAFLGEIRIGKTRAEALESMSNRVGLESLSTFLSALIQADRMGTSLGQTLRIQAEQIRNERSQRAEKLAGEAPVKMLIPLVLFIFPTIWIILGAPLLFEWIFKGGH